MESIIVTGDATGVYSAHPGIAFELRGVDIDIPLDEIGISGPCVTISGASTGDYTFYHSTNVTKRFLPNEDIYITTTDFSGNYSAIVNYIQAGDMTSYMQADVSRSGVVGFETFWRYR